MNFIPLLTFSLFNFIPLSTLFILFILNFIPLYQLYPSLTSSLKKGAAFVVVALCVVKKSDWLARQVVGLHARDLVRGQPYSSTRIKGKRDSKANQGQSRIRIRGSRESGSQTVEDNNYVRGNCGAAL
jgi:hypothetical protein